MSMIVKIGKKGKAIGINDTEFVAIRVVGAGIHGSSQQDQKKENDFFHRCDSLFCIFCLQSYGKSCAEQSNLFFFMPRWRKLAFF